jgi:hypothetical protein
MGKLKTTPLYASRVLLSSQFGSLVLPSLSYCPRPRARHDAALRVARTKELEGREVDERYTYSVGMNGEGDDRSRHGKPAVNRHSSCSRIPHFASCTKSFPLTVCPDGINSHQLRNPRFHLNWCSLNVREVRFGRKSAQLFGLGVPCLCDSHLGADDQ